MLLPNLPKSHSYTMDAGRELLNRPSDRIEKVSRGVAKGNLRLGCQNFAFLMFMDQKIKKKI